MRTRRVVVKIIYYYANLLGVTSIRLDFETHQIRQNIWTVLYSALANIVLLVSLPFAIKSGMYYLKLYQENKLLIIMDATNTIIRCSVLIFTVLLRLKREKSYKKLAKLIFNLDQCYFRKLEANEEIERRSHILFLCKVFTTGGQSLALAFNMWQTSRRSLDVGMILLICYFTTVHNFIHGVMLHYYGALLQAYTRYCMLNVQLRKLLETLSRFCDNTEGLLHKESFTFQQLSRLAAADLYEISCIYMKLTRIVWSLNHDYQYYVFAVLMSYLIYNVAYGYNLFLILDGTLNSGGSHFTFAFGGSCMCLLFADLFLFYWTCEATTQSSQSTSRLFKEISGLLVLSKMDPEFERHVGRLSWILPLSHFICFIKKLCFSFAVRAVLAAANAMPGEHRDYGHVRAEHAILAGLVEFYAATHPYPGAI